jgi:ATP-dependent Clp protease ATP-binding subunit ClpA
VAASSVLHDAATEAAELGHGWIGPEHVLLAILRGGSAAGESLRACDVDHESYRQAFLAASGYIRMRSAGRPAEGAHVVTADVQIVLARAEGMAAGQGSKVMTPEHVMLALLWARTSLPALTLLERLGVTREGILHELERRGASLGVPMPAHPLWGDWLQVSKPEFERLAARLRHAGVLYRYGEQGEEVLISIAKPPEKSSPSEAKPGPE